MSSFSTLKGACRYALNVHGSAKILPRTEAWYAREMLALLEVIEQTPPDSCRQAIQAAFDLGLLLKEAGHVRRTRSKKTPGGIARGLQQTASAESEDRRIRRYISQYEASDELQDTYRSVVSFLMSRTGKSKKTIQRRLKILKSRPRAA